MRKFELIVGLIAILTILYRGIFWTELNVLMILSVSTIATFYMYLSFALFNGLELKKIFKKETYKGLIAKRIIGTVGLGFALSFTSIGILFKIMSWPGASAQLGAGIIFLAIIGLIGLTRYLKSKTDFYVGIFKRIAILGGLGLLFWLTPKETQLKILYRDHADYVEAYKEAMNDPYNEELWDKVDEEREKMNKK